MTSPITRFAPSPTGALHLGHAYSALFAARAAGPKGTFLLRIEDIDRGRCREPFIAGLRDDLAWLGLSWPEPVRRQSEHLADYAAALARLDAMGLLYPCFCTRADIAGAASAPQGPDGPVYHGRCKGLAAGEVAALKAMGRPFALRLDTEEARRMAGPLTWRDQGAGEVAARPEIFGDVVLARKDIATSYHLAVTVDDALQGVSLVTRGQDLFAATHIHRLLQALLGLPVPLWHHHGLLLDETGQRLAKRAGSPALAALRAAGETPDGLRARLGFS